MKKNLHVTSRHNEIMPNKAQHINQTYSFHSFYLHAGSFMPQKGVRLVRWNLVLGSHAGGAQNALKQSVSLDSSQKPISRDMHQKWSPQAGEPLTIS